MKLDKYIHDLLKENETVIIPGFGAFFSEYKPAEISETEIKPPSKQISFSSNIRNNDGLLVGHVAIAEQVSHFDALKLIEKERDNIIFLLDKGEKVSLEEIGELSSNDKNEIVFFPYQIENFSMEHFGLETVSLEKLNEIQPEPQDEEIIPPPAEHVQETNEENVSEESEEKSESELIGEATIENEINEDAETQEEEIEKQQSSLEEQEEILKNATQEPVAEPVFVMPQEEEPKKEEKKKGGWYWYLLILIPIIVAGIFVVKNTSDSKPEIADSKQVDLKQTPQPEEQAEVQPIVPEDSMEIAQENTINQDSTTLNTLEEVTEIDTFSGPVFYLIGGSFKESEENALTYIEELKDKGFEPFYMGKQGNFFTVAIGKYKTEGQAVRARDTIWMKYPDWQIWVKEE